MNDFRMKAFNEKQLPNIKMDTMISYVVDKLKVPKELLVNGIQMVRRTDVEDEIKINIMKEIYGIAGVPLPNIILPKTNNIKSTHSRIVEEYKRKNKDQPNSDGGTIPGGPNGFNKTMKKLINNDASVQLTDVDIRRIQGFRKWWKTLTVEDQDKWIRQVVASNIRKMKSDPASNNTNNLEQRYFRYIKSNFGRKDSITIQDLLTYPIAADKSDMSELMKTLKLLNKVGETKKFLDVGLGSNSKLKQKPSKGGIFRYLFRSKESRNTSARQSWA